MCLHLIGFQLSGENANKNNLINGTRYLNVEGMLPFENMVADTELTYIINTNNKKFHKTDCSSVTHIKDSNKKIYTRSREDIISQGYTPYGHCNP